MFLSLLPITATAMLKVFLTCAVGAILVRRKVISDSFLFGLSRMVIMVFLPCLLVTKISKSLNVDEVKTLWILPFAAVTYVCAGALLGLLTRRLCCPREEFRRFYTAACAEANSGYLPIMLATTLCALSPRLASIDGSADKAVAYISLYLIGFVPTLWGWAFPYISGHKLDRTLIKKILNPPFIAALSGIVIGLTPLKDLFWPVIANGTESKPALGILTSTAVTLGEPTIPCAMLILGGNLSRGPARDLVPIRTITGAIVCRLLLMPMVGLGFVTLLKAMNLMPNDPILQLVLLIAASSPSAMNLAVMAQTIRKEEKSVATLLFWVYLAALFTISGFAAFYLYLVFR